MLTLRLIEPNDYLVREEGQYIGRIRFANERTPGVWLWHHGHDFRRAVGSAKDIHEAKQRFKATWRAFRHGAEALAKACADMDYAKRPDRCER